MSECHPIRTPQRTSLRRPDSFFIPPVLPSILGKDTSFPPDLSANTSIQYAEILPRKLQDMFQQWQEERVTIEKKLMEGFTSEQLKQICLLEEERFRECPLPEAEALDQKEIAQFAADGISDLFRLTQEIDAFSNPRLITSKEGYSATLHEGYIPEGNIRLALFLGQTKLSQPNFLALRITYLDQYLSDEETPSGLRVSEIAICRISADPYFTFADPLVGFPNLRRERKNTNDAARDIAETIRFLQNNKSEIIKDTGRII